MAGEGKWQVTADLVYLWLGGSHLYLDRSPPTHLAQGLWVSWSLLCYFRMGAQSRLGQELGIRRESGEEHGEKEPSGLGALLGPSNLFLSMQSLPCTFFPSQQNFLFHSLL